MRIQNPMLGRKRTRSATTNPTRKKRLEAGRNVMAIRVKPNAAVATELLFLGHLTIQPKENNMRRAKVTNVRRWWM